MCFARVNRLLTRCLFVESVRSTLSTRFYLWLFLTYSGYQSHAPLNDFFSFEKLCFGGRQSKVSMTIVVFISCQFHSHVRSLFDQVQSLIYYDKVICNFAEMEGYYVEITCSVFKSHSRNTFCKRNVYEEGGVSIERKPLAGRP